MALAKRRSVPGPGAALLALAALAGACTAGRSLESTSYGAPGTLRHLDQALATDSAALFVIGALEVERRESRTVFRVDRIGDHDTEGREGVFVLHPGACTFHVAVEHRRRRGPATEESHEFTLVLEQGRVYALHPAWVDPVTWNMDFDVPMRVTWMDVTDDDLGRWARSLADEAGREAAKDEPDGPLH